MWNAVTTLLKVLNCPPLHIGGSLWFYSDTEVLTGSGPAYVINLPSNTLSLSGTTYYYQEHQGSFV